MSLANINTADAAQALSVCDKLTGRSWTDLGYSRLAIFLTSQGLVT